MPDGPCCRWASARPGCRCTRAWNAPWPNTPDAAGTDRWPAYLSCVPPRRATGPGAGLPTDPERVVAGPGSKPLLFALMTTLDGPVALPRPSWVSYGAQAALIGRDAVYVATRPGQGGVPDPGRLDALAATARRDGRPLGRRGPHAPRQSHRHSGRGLDSASCATWPSGTTSLVISDEIYRDLVHDDADVVPQPGRGDPPSHGRHHRPEQEPGPRRLADRGRPSPRRPARRQSGRRGRKHRERDLVRARPCRCSGRPPGRSPSLTASESGSDSAGACTAGWRAPSPTSLRGAGAGVPHPLGGFYLYPDFERHRDRLRRVHRVDDGPGLATALLDGPGIATLPGSAFGDATSAPAAARRHQPVVRPTREQQEEALTAEDPPALPWIAAQLTTLRNGLDQLVGSS